MKKHLILSLIIAGALLGTTERAGAEFRYGPTAGVTISSLKYKQQEFFPTGHDVGGMAGVQGELMLGGLGFGLDLGAYLSMQGGKVDLGRWPLWNEQYGKENIRLYSLDIPLNLRFKWTRLNGFEDILAPYVIGGPIFSFNLAHSGCKAFDYAVGSIALQAGGGFEIKRHWQATVAYVWGMTYDCKLAKQLDNSARSRYWTVRVAYLF